MSLNHGFNNERLKELREQKRWSQTELAQKIGVSKQTIHEYELGKKSPSREKLAVLADLFNTSVDYLMGRTDDKRPINEIKEELEMYKEKVPDLLTYAKLKRPTFRGKIITEEEAKEYNKLFDMFLDMLEAKAEKNAKSGMINVS